MTQLAGFIPSAPNTPPVTTRDNYHLADALDTLTVDYWPPHASTVTAPPVVTPGDSASHLPVAIVHRPNAGDRGAAYSDDWYHHIHVVPATLRLGNLLSTQTRTVEIWNAFFATQHLGAIDAANADGITFNGDPNVDYTPLQSRLYNVTVSTGGPPAIDATYTLHFGDRAPAFRILGDRVVVFAFSPNWAQPVTETAEYATDVLTAIDQTEQRIRLRDTPRESVQYAIATTGTDAARLDGLLYAWQARAYSLPLWTDAGPLGQSVSAGAQSLPRPVSHARFVAGGLFVLLTGAGAFEAGQIAAVNADSIDLQHPIAQDWPATAIIAPARLARLPASQNVARSAAANATAQFSFDYVDRYDQTAAELTSRTYRGDPLVLRQPNRRNSLTETYARVVDKLDNTTGIRTYDDISDRNMDRQSWSWLAADRDAVADLRAFVAARAGKLVPFWAPTWRRDLEVVAPITATSTSLTVTDIGYRQFLVNRANRQDIALLHIDGTWYTRRITGASAAGTVGRENLALDTAIGIDAAPADWRLVCFLVHWRADADALKLTHHSRDVAELSLPMVSVA